MRLRLTLLFLGAFLSAILMAETEMPPLKGRQPNWRPHILENYPNGNPKEVLFHEMENELEKPVKQLLFHPDGHIEKETDVIQLEEGEIVPDGASVNYHRNGAIAQKSCYAEGRLEGLVQTFYESGQLKTSSNYQNGVRHGLAQAYHPNGNLKEEATYEEGKINGDFLTYHSDGSPASQIPYEKGLPHGNALEWYAKEENEGGLKASRNYVDGLLHGDGKSPALMIYGNELALLEVQDYRKGKPFGLHLKYYPNGQSSYRVNYVDGLKEGEEQFSHEDGTIAGGGKYHQGVPRGEHLLRFSGGELQKRASYNEKGKLVQPIAEYYESGQTKKVYTLEGENYEGSFQSWHPNGQLKEDHFYVNGTLEGEQKEYYEQGQLKLQCCFSHQKLNGPFQEWYENGNPKTVKAYVQGVVDGEHTEWYDNQQKHLEAHYVRGKLVQTRREWTKEGVLIFKGEYEEGMPHGVIETWYQNGKPRQISHFEKGRRHGVEEIFFENGQKQSLAYFKEDLLDREFQSWHEDGSVHTLMSYEEGVPVGEHREYYPPVEKGKAGQIARVFHYAEGNLDGEQLSYHPDNQIAALVVYCNGRLSGEKKQWDRRGILIEEATYVDGKLEGRYFQMGPNGEEIVFHYKNDQRNGIHQVFYPEDPERGKVKRLDATFENDLLEGEFSEYNEHGTKMASTFYKKGLREGIATLYSEKNGMLMMSMEFHADKREGKAVSYYPDGKVYKEVGFVDDVRNGPTRTFHEDGSLASLFFYEDDHLEGLGQEWNTDGILIFAGEYRDDLKHGKFNKYYDDGTPRLLCTYEEDKIVGEKKIFDSLGKKKR